MQPNPNVANLPSASTPQSSSVPAANGHHPTALFEEFSEVPVAEVVVNVEAPDLLPTYSYRIPERLAGEIAVGTCVHVPFGGRETVGYVIDRRNVDAAEPIAGRLRDIIGIVEGAVTFSPEQADVARWISEFYVCDLSSAVRCIAPAALGSRVEASVRLANPELTDPGAGLAMVQAHILTTLKQLGGEAELEELKKAASVSAFNGSYAALLRKGLVTETRAVSRARVVARTVRAYDLPPNSMSTPSTPYTGIPDQTEAKPSRSSPAGQRILTALAIFAAKGETPILPEKLLNAAQCSMAALKTLVEKGQVVIRELHVRRAPGQTPDHFSTAPNFTPGQRRAAEWIADQLRGEEEEKKRKGEEETNRIETPLGTWHRGTQPPTPNSLPVRAQYPTPNTALLFGVTASGKTEVYLDAIANTLKAGRNAIVLVPEIALTAQVVEIFTGRFGDEVAVLHSRLSEGERHDEWRRLQQSHARIAVGARSAVFAPLDNIGLIVVDEEHEASYKQESSPRYNARDVAVRRAQDENGLVLLGSATPSLETFFASEHGDIARLEMPDRIGGRALPVVDLVDLRQEMKEHRALFSRTLIDRLGDRLAKGQQSILFLNRRGYAQFMLCRECGYVARCPNCAVSLAFHAAWSSLRCHHCGYSRGVPTVCPTCGSAQIKGFGIGTERVEEEVAKHFPNARIARMDRDTTARKGAHAGILKRFRDREADILIGTQMIAKGLDFPNVTLVGVVSADTSINMPDFRASERTFQLLTQVAGRAGRGEHPGEVVIQTFTPEHFALQRAVHQDYRGFYEKEILNREELRYPPFSRLVNMVCSDEDSNGARGRAQALAGVARKVLPKEVELIGPSPAPLVKLKNIYRWHVVLRAPSDFPISELVRQVLAKLPAPDRRRITVDVDPMGMA